MGEGVVDGRVLIILSYRHSKLDDKTCQAADKSQPSSFRFVWGSKSDVNLTRKWKGLAVKDDTTIIELPSS
jgi:hypothetical protein